MGMGNQWGQVVRSLCIQSHFRAARGPKLPKSQFIPRRFSPLNTSVFSNLQQIGFDPSTVGLSNCQ